MINNYIELYNSLYNYYHYITRAHYIRAYSFSLYIFKINYNKIIK